MISILMECIKGKRMLQNNLLVKFDVNNVEHRKVYFNFWKNMKWDAKAPRFEVEQPYLDVPSMIQSKLVQYYQKQEFTKTKPRKE